MNIYQVLILSENKKKGKGFYTSRDVLANNFENAVKLAIEDAHEKGYITNVSEIELLKKNVEETEEKIINKFGRSFFDL